MKFVFVVITLSHCVHIISAFEPRILTIWPKVFVSEGDNADIICKAQFAKNHTMVWRKKSGEIISKNNEIVLTENGHRYIAGRFDYLKPPSTIYTLRIKNAKQNDSGNYRCELFDDAVRQNPQFDSELQVLVEMKEYFKDQIYASGNQRRNIGDTATFVLRGLGVNGISCNWKRIVDGEERDIPNRDVKSYYSQLDKDLLIRILSQSTPQSFFNCCLEFKEISEYDQGKYQGEIEYGEPAKKAKVIVELAVQPAI